MWKRMWAASQRFRPFRQSLPSPGAQMGPPHTSQKGDSSLERVWQQVRWETKAAMRRRVGRRATASSGM